MPSELAFQIVDALMPGILQFATDFMGRKPRKKFKLTRKKRIELAEGIDKWIGFSTEVDSYKTPAASAAEYISRLERLGEMLRPFMEVPKGTVLPYSLRDSYGDIIDQIGRWTYFPRTNYREIAADLDALTSAAFAINPAAVDNLLNEFWSSPDGAVVARTPYTIVIRRCVYLKNARRKLDRRLVERLVETYRELSGLYEKELRAVIGIMEILVGKAVPYPEIMKRSFASNIDQVSASYPWLTKDFNVVIRNSIAHTSSIVSYSSNTITFKDRKNALTVTFRDFFRRSRLLSSLVAAMLLLHVFYFYWRWKAVSEHYDKMKQLARKP